jgi:tetratricopeptide (TPR) repeat protein
MVFINKFDNGVWLTGMLRAGHYTGFLGLLTALSLVAGCAVSTPAVPEPVVQRPPVVEKQTIARLDGERTGFVITETPDPTALWHSNFDRAVALLQEGRDTEAIPILEEIVLQSPGVTAPFINLAMAYRHTEQFDQAEQQLQAALKLVPGHPVANNEYGLLLRQTGRFTESREVYEATLHMFPEYLPVRLNLGILCELYLKDSDCAVEQYKFYREANPDNEAVPVWIADLNLRMGRD